MTPPRPNPDVIVVGAGSAGAAVTRRLVDAGCSVLLLEAGGADSDPAIADPARMFELWSTPHDWNYLTVPQPQAANRRLPWPRGKVLGGSSSLNAMIYVRGARSDYDRWACLGNPGWAWADVLPVFRRMEDYDGGACALHGVGGPLRILSRYTPDPVHAAVKGGFVDLGLRLNADYNSGLLDGVSSMAFTIKDRRRHNTAAAYLRPIESSPTLTVLTGARARRLLMNGTRCVGVEWVRGNRVETATAGQEVIVSAGAIESPRLLMLSGIGDADHLAAVGIDVVVDLPGVGRNLHDHLLAPVILTTDRPIGPPTPGLPLAQTHLWTRSRPDAPGPDIQPLAFSFPLYSEPWMAGPDNGISLLAGMVRPNSRGSIRLTGTDPDDPLLIDPATFTCEEDLTALVDAVRLCREVAATKSLRDWTFRETYPGPETASLPALRDYVRRTVMTYHHQAGTCKMGADAASVVDARLRVHGVEGLRVADASIMPAVTSGNTNAPSILIGERAADFVLAD
ncbi:GMC oxidoreductase [Mycobacterium kubicae]|uniref:GMC family oxidoreductase N-terminal domain-containing protein n=1 Tax=Mycobacterium kubicae TaxID=120959 RepID=A0AAX1JEX3_9MYCO|nr:GMC family oxidoreductase N-terminal domain-containing protein [Mycobacterium kubicae]MCV7097142.1 GMC family oxidoreductase N-terminal domain-containing protein [Mycobacterium kubicae]ORW03139.1 hypothetical protein AWC13_02825 [Mycobacterium kubicae]QNI11547.1 oxidoreductase [Mycobacterium kubicae]QPI39766.1 GMC family oxidoreductase N-terminal domain-containing protein [Mycobacterium kubicae]GFG64396.1 GMC oxidoreductase [Mycobacterium kubicae]